MADTILRDAMSRFNADTKGIVNQEAIVPHSGIDAGNTIVPYKPGGPQARVDGAYALLHDLLLESGSKKEFDTAYLQQHGANLEETLANFQHTMQNTTLSDENKLSEIRLLTQSIESVFDNAYGGRAQVQPIPQPPSTGGPSPREPPGIFPQPGGPLKPIPYTGPPGSRPPGSYKPGFNKEIMHGSGSSLSGQSCDLQRITETREMIELTANEIKDLSAKTIELKELLKELWSGCQGSIRNEACKQTDMNDSLLDAVHAADDAHSAPMMNDKKMEACPQKCEKPPEQPPVPASCPKCECPQEEPCTPKRKRKLPCKKKRKVCKPKPACKKETREIDLYSGYGAPPRYDQIPHPSTLQQYPSYWYPDDEYDEENIIPGM